MGKQFSYTFYSYLSLGTNLGNRSGNLILAAKKIEKECGEILVSSGIYESDAWGYESSQKYYNQCILVKTPCDPSQLLKKINEIEAEMGRVRIRGTLSDRKIDIDIIMYESLQISTQDLLVPHPRMTERNFVLQPLKEIAPDLIHPVLQKSIKILSEECVDTNPVLRLSDK